jgi:polysaccharide chain length determinant protein (PEP-CTERM system associated)
MKKSRFNTFNDYLALIVRRRWWVLVTTAALCCLTILFAMIFPKSYTSKTMILIQSRDVPSDIVKDLIGGDPDERLSTIQQTIFSRTNLLKILGEYENQLLEYRNLNDERKVEKLKKRITIDLLSEKRRGKYLPTTNIIISYRDRNPALAQKITARIASLFIEQDNKARENKVFGTAEFLDTELKKVTDELAKSELALKSLKQRYRYEMPSELDTNLRTLDRLQIQKNGNLEALDRFVTLQMNLERQISETQPMIPQASVEKPNSLVNAVHAQQIDSYRKKEQEYSALIVKAKPTHPDVQRLKGELEQLRKELLPEELTALGSKNSSDQTDQIEQAMAPNPIYRQLTAQLHSLMTDIEIRQKEKKWIENEMAKYNQRIQNMPAVEQEMLAITRANAELAKQHDGLKAKLEQANLASSLESRQKGAQFEILDRANYPLEPSTPGKTDILIIGFAISLAIGVVVAIIASIFNQRIWTQYELERALEAPVLVEIPSMITPSYIRNARRKMVMHAAVGIFCACVYCGGLYYLYLKQSAVVRLLGPLFEKIVERSAN